MNESLAEAVHLIHIGEVIGVLSELIIGTSVVIFLDLTRWQAFYQDKNFDLYIYLKDEGHNILAWLLKAKHGLLHKSFFFVLPAILMTSGLASLLSLYYEKMFSFDIKIWFYITLMLFIFTILNVIVVYILKSGAKKAENDLQGDIF